MFPTRHSMDMEVNVTTVINNTWIGRQILADVAYSTEPLCKLESKVLSWLLGRMQDGAAVVLLAGKLLMSLNRVPLLSKQAYLPY